MASQARAHGQGFFKPRRLGHANLYVGNLEQSMAFYIQVAGLEETYQRPPIRAGFVGNGNTHHDVGMVEADGPGARGKRPGLNHLAFELENEVELVDGYRQAVQAGVRFARTVDHEIARSLYIHDPDGNLNEIYADTTKNWRTERTGLVQNPTLGWTPGEPAPSPESKYHENPEIHRVDAAAFHPLRVTHAVIVAGDFEAVFRHYTELVGLSPVLGDATASFAVLAGRRGGRDISLFRARPDRPPGLHHVGFLVADEHDLDEGVARLRKAGLEPELQIGHATRRSVFLRDPDGLRLEFYVDGSTSLDRPTGVDEGIALFLA
jgi:catechol 2,3-dioxygenase